MSDGVDSEAASCLLTVCEVDAAGEVVEAAAVLLRKGELTLRSTAPNGLEAGSEDEDEAGGEADAAAVALLTITGALYSDMIHEHEGNHIIQLRATDNDTRDSGVM